MAKVKLVGNTLIAEINGNMYCNNELSKEEQIEILIMISNYPAPKDEEEANAQEAEVRDRMHTTVLAPEAEVKRAEKIEEYKTIVNIVSNMDDNLDKDLFEFKDNILTYKNIPLSIPKVLALRISKANAKEKSALINFWYRCAKNNNARSRQDLFEFIERYKFQVLPSGLFVAYRNVVLKDTFSELFNFTNDLVNQIKIWKRSLNYYTIVNHKTGYVSVENSKPNYQTRLNKVINESGYIDATVLGTCKEVWEDLIYNKNIFTDQRTQTFNISLNKVIEMDRKQCDSDPRKDCSYGLHVGTPDFLSKSSFGNVCIAVLIDPEDVIAVPEYYVNKMRVCKYYPVAFTSYDDRGKLIELNLKEDEIEYCTIKIEQVKEFVDNKDKFEEYKKNELVPQELSYDIYMQMGDYFEKISKVVNSRMKKVE